MDNSSDLSSFTFEAVDRCPVCASERRESWSLEDEDVPAVRCLDCTLVYLTRRLTAESAGAYYSGFAERRDSNDPGLHEQRQRMYELDRRFVHRFALPGPLLDYGCGNGEFTALVRQDRDAAGFEPDTSAIDAARERWPHIDFADHVAPLRDRNGPFATVVFRGSLQYVRDFAALGADIERSLVPEGRVLLLATPNADSPLANLLRERWVLHNRIEHLVTFNLRSVDRLFADFELDYVDFPYVGTPYEHLDEDLRRFVAVCRGDASETRFPFWGSMMNVVLQRTA